MNPAGSLFDSAKLRDVSNNIISKMDAEKVFSLAAEWAEEFDADFADKLKKDPEFAKRILSIGRGGKKPRKDFAIWSELKAYMGFFYDEYFTLEDSYPDNFTKSDIIGALEQYKLSYDESDDMNQWFEKIKAIADSLGYASDMKAYKENPTLYKGNVADISMFIRLAVTGKLNAPDLYSVVHIIGKEKTFERINKIINSLN
jgi:glutamyl-tRNA synthetase